jgi:S1-C subfamily serine protease
LIKVRPAQAGRFFLSGGRRVTTKSLCAILCRIALFYVGLTFTATDNPGELLYRGATMSYLRNLPFGAVLCLLLTGCVADTTDLAVESRTIAVEQNAIPTSASAGSASVDSVAHLLPTTGPTYVTLTVTEVDRNFNGKASDQSRRALTSGSGFIVDGNGYAMTAAHVAVARGNLVSARAADGRIYSGSVISLNPANDMAIVKLRGYAGRAARPASSTCISPGALVFSLGRPHAQGDTARVGTLGSMSYGRQVRYGKFGYPDAMVLKMSTQKGESGGPVFDAYGRLIGMVVSTLSDQNGDSINLAHAIYASSLAQFLCSQTTCGPDWAAIARMTPERC